jgi:hypothetical protein
MKTFGKFSNLILTGILLLAVFYVIFFKIQPELYYHVQQTSFFTISSYFNEYMGFPGGPATYASGFLVQFFMSNLAGSLIILFLGCLITSLIYLTYRSLVPDLNIMLCGLPFIMLTGMLFNYNIPFSIAVNGLIVSLFAYIYSIVVRRNKWNMFTLLIMLPLAYYLAGPGFLIPLVATIIITNLLIIKSLRLNALFMSGIIIYALLTDYMAYKFLFAVAPGKAFFSFFPQGRGDVLVYAPDVLFYLFIFLLPATGLVLYLSLYLKGPDNILSKTKPITRYLSVFVFMILVLAFVYHRSYDKHRKNIVLVDFYTCNENWMKSAATALADPNYDIYINFNYNRAIDNAGLYLESFFKYPQLMGTDALYPDKLYIPQLTMISSDYYFDLGLIRESEHWANEALIDFPYSTRILKRLVMTNMILGNYRGAEKYLDVLSENLTTRAFTARYAPLIADTALISKDSLIMYKRSCLPDRMYRTDNIVLGLDELISKNKFNRRAYDHRQIYFLLEHQLGSFAENLDESMKFYNYPPKIYQEAIEIYNYNLGYEKINKYKVLREVANKFRLVVETMSKNKDKEVAKVVLKNYSDTYMYYVLFNSPLVTNFHLTRNSTIGY